MSKIIAKVAIPEKIVIKLNNLGYGIEDTKEIFELFLEEIVFDPYSHTFNNFSNWIEDPEVIEEFPNHLKLD